MEKITNKLTTMIESFKNLIPEGYFGVCCECKKFITKEECDKHDHYCPDCAKKLKEIEKKYNRSFYELQMRDLPDEYKKWKFEDVAKYKNTSLYLYGETNTGKTILATSILRYRWAHGLPGKFIVFPQKVSEMATDINRTQMLMQLRTTEGCLVLDEFGGGMKMGDYYLQAANDILNHRSSNNLQTILTSNWNILEVEEHIGPRVASRIVRLCGKKGIVKKTKVFDIGGK